MPAASIACCADPALGASAAAALSGPRFRVYWTDDVVGGRGRRRGQERAGDRRRHRRRARARRECAGRADHPRLAELARFGEAEGARRETLMGLSGLGDLVLTAGSLTSRNMAFGHAIGRGADLAALRRHPGPLVEGVPTAAAVMRRAGELGLDPPICAAVDAILAGRLTSRPHSPA